MADPVILEIEANTTAINASLDELDKKFDDTGGSAKKAGKETESAFDKAAKSVKKAEAEVDGIGETIRDQERITAEFRKEVERLHKEFVKAGGKWKKAAQPIQKSMNDINRSIRENVKVIKDLKIDKRAASQTVTALKKTAAEAKKVGKAVKTSKGEMNSLDKTISSIGSKIVAVFAVQKIISFGKEAANMAAEFEGVEHGFNQLNDPALLGQLRHATRGTISDLNLMKKAVKANNFKIPLDTLATAFEFASKRANQTGEDVNQLTDNIVQGLGTKSPKVIDNLGISSAELAEEIRKTGDFATATANIMEREMRRMGDATDTTSEKTDKYNAAIDNLSVTIGQKLNPAISDLTEATTLMAQTLNVNLKDDQTDWFDILTTAIFDTDEAMQKYLKSTLESIKAEATSIEQKKIMAGISFGVSEPELEIQKGIVQTLKEKIEVQEKIIQNSPNQNEINNALALRLALETRLTATLNQRRLLDDTGDNEKAEIADEPMLDLTFDDDFLKAAQAEQITTTQETEDEVTRIIEAAISERQQLQLDSIDNTRAAEDYAFSVRQKNAAASMQLATATAELTKTLANQTGDQAKAMAVFMATITAALAINAVLADPTLGTYERFALAAVAGITAAAQVAAIATSSPPKFFEGTEYVGLNGNPAGKDTIPAMLHQGEAVITASANSQHKGLAKAWNGGTLNEHLSARYVLPALHAQKREIEEANERQFATTIANNITGSKMTDGRIVSELRRGRAVNEDILEQSKHKRRRTNFRA